MNRNALFGRSSTWIGVIGNHLPRRCGMATFTTDLLRYKLCTFSRSDVGGGSAIKDYLTWEEAGNYFRGHVRIRQTHFREKERQE